MNGNQRLFMRFARFYARKINPAFTITATAFFGGKAFIHHSADVKNSRCKKNNN
jgi:hypothetical protein